MQKFIFYLMLLTFAITSCEQNDMELEQLELSKNNSTLKGEITVIGQNDPLIDPVAVQNAVDNYNIVILTGIFDFGYDPTNGGVDITRPDMILQGPATIANGAKSKFFTGLGTLNYPLSIQSPGVEVRELDITSDNYGIIVHVEQQGKPVIVKNNKIKTSIDAISVSSTSCGIKVLDNDLEGAFGYYGYKTLGNVEIKNNHIMGWDDGIYILDFDHKLDIINNTIDSFVWEAMYIGAWRVTEGSGPDWGDNAPVKIIGNSIEISGIYAGGILVGTSHYGLNNTMVTENIITGEANFGGLVKEPYGHNNSFINNDLTGLNTNYYPQIWTMGGHHNQYINNKLGTVIGDAGTAIWTVNWHYQDDWLFTPDPVNYANHYSQNDYSQTGLPGWSEDPETMGAVLLSDVLKRFTVDWVETEEPYTMKNYINEKKFPDGTDLCTQILDLSNLEGDDRVMGTNQIAGWNTCEVQAAKATYKKASKRYENFGQALKERNMKRKSMRKLIK